MKLAEFLLVAYYIIYLPFCIFIDFVYIFTPSRKTELPATTRFVCFILRFQLNNIRAISFYSNEFAILLLLD